MARTTGPNTAQAQFFINLVDNALLDATLDQPGYAVFGSVVSGLDVVDAIGSVAVASVDENFDSVPVDEITILSVLIETGEQRVNPLWQSYLDTYGQGVQYNFLSLLRSTFVNSASQLLAR